MTDMQTQIIDKVALERFFDFLRFQSISTDCAYDGQVRSCCNWVVDQLKTLGFDVEIWETDGAPVIFASWLKGGTDKPTVLLYHHYDVQPVEPVDAWESGPFEPTIRQGEVYARGAQDNKGQCFYTLEAIRYLLKTTGKLPVNLKFCIEGEEEHGSCGLLKIMSQHKAELSADYLAVVDVGMRDAKTPAVTLGCRGIVTFELLVKGPNKDLHSGSHGGLVVNPIHALTEILAKLHDPKTGEVTIPGFYDDVAPLTIEEKSQLSLEFDEKQYTHDFGVLPCGGEKAFSSLERVWVRPTLEINGISGGYSGEGFKTVIASQALAKLSCRLVANQDPDKIADLVIRYVQGISYKGVELSIKRFPGGGKAVRTSPNSPIVKAFLEAYTEAFGIQAVCILEGGSIPITAELQKVCGGALVFVGVGLATDQIHSPNEHFGLDRIEKGAQAMVKALQNLEKNHVRVYRNTMDIRKH